MAIEENNGVDESTVFGLAAAAASVVDMIGPFERRT